MFTYCLLLFSLIFTAPAWSEDTHPLPPEGWVELNSLEPVILTWAKALPSKKLAEVPSFAVQKFNRTEKFLKFIQEKKLDKDSCRELSEGGWNQTWCLRKKSILVIASRNEDKESVTIKKKLRSWVLSHD